MLEFFLEWQPTGHDDLLIFNVPIISTFCSIVTIIWHSYSQLALLQCHRAPKILVCIWLHIQLLPTVKTEAKYLFHSVVIY